MVVISAYDWDKPIFMKKCNELKVLTLHMRECVAMEKELISKGEEIMK